MLGAREAQAVRACRYRRESAEPENRRRSRQSLSRRFRGSTPSSRLERSINGLSPEARVAVRRKDIVPLVNDLIDWMKRERGKLSRHNEVAKAFDYMLKRIDVFTRFLDDGRICLSNNAAERELRGIALGRKSWLFAGSDRGGDRAAVMLTLIQTAKLNDVDPQAWLADVLARIADHKITDLAALLPWNWRRIVPDRPRRLTWR